MGAVSVFFLPGLRPGVESERAYADLRTRTEQRTGCAIRPTRIYELHCRREGVDRQSRVGEPDPRSGETVHAIFATRATYTVIWKGGYADVTRSQVYEAIPFES